MARSPQQRLLAIAARQHSVFTRAQALESGFTPKMVRHRVGGGLWVRLHPGVFLLGGSARNARPVAMAACLATGGAAARRTAAQLWGMPAPPPDRPEVVTAHGRRRRRDPIRVIQSRTLLRGDIVHLDRVPITSPARTLIDLAGVLPLPSLEACLDDVLARGLVTLSRVERRIERQPSSGTTGIGRLRTLVDEYHPLSAESKSHLSQKFVRLFRRLGLPEPEVEMAIDLRDGRTIHSDLGYRQHRVAIEIQSRRWHTGRATTEADLSRENELELAHYSLFHLTAGDLRRPDYVKRLISEGLESI